MATKKNGMYSIPAEMQATLNQERERQIQIKREQFQKTLEFVGKKMEKEFVKAESDKDLIQGIPMVGDMLINPAQKENDGEILSQNV